MIDKILHSRLLIITVIGLFMALYGWYLLYQPAGDISVSLPGMDNRPQEKIEEEEIIVIGEFFSDFNAPTQRTSGSWSRFRGTAFENISPDSTPIAEKWPADGPEEMWRIELGEGHAGPAVHKGKVYVLDYDERKKADTLRVFSFETGKELWRRWYSVYVKRNHGMSRTIPTVTDEVVLTIGPRCHVMATATNSGDFLWGMDLIKDHGAVLPQWYTAQCPLTDDNTVVIAIGGENLLVGVDVMTGKTIWETPNPDNWKMSHSSIFVSSFHGKKTYVYLAVGGIVGVSAEGNDVGRILWKSSAWNPTVVATSPVFPGNNEIIVTTGYGAGGARFKIEKTAVGFEANLIEKHRPKEGLSSEHQTPIITGEYIWTIEPKDAGALRNQLVCYHVSDLKNPVWNSGKEYRFGLGPYLLVGDKLFLLNDDSELFLYKITDNKNATLLARHKVLEDGVDAWGPVVFIDGYLILRDSRRMVKLDVRL